MTGISYIGHMAHAPIDCEKFTQRPGRLGKKILRLGHLTQQRPASGGDGVRHVNQPYKTTQTMHSRLSDVGTTKQLKTPPLNLVPPV